LPADLTYDQQGNPSYASDHPISSYDAAGSYGSYEAAASYGSLPTCSSYREASGWAGGHRSCGIDWQGEGIYDVETVEGERKNEVGTAEGGEYALAEGYADLEGEYADEEGGNAGADEAAYGDASQFADHYDGEFDRVSVALFFLQNPSLQTVDLSSMGLICGAAPSTESRHVKPFP
jgi:hypothetical protein